VDFPDPPLDGRVDPAIHMWDADKPLVRACDLSRGPLAFNPTAVSGRFRPFRASDGVVPTAYAAEDDETAIAERLLRGVDVRAQAPRRLLLRAIHGVALATVIPRRPLRLARLHGLGLRRLGLSRAALIDSGADRYPWTARWAKALHACDETLDGLVWSSRQNDGALALMLFGDRVRVADLRAVGSSLPLESELGLRRLIEICAIAGVEIPGLGGR
jgi:RES domain-containing protein